MRFFFVDPIPAQQEGPWSAPQELRRHLRALRLEPGEVFLILAPSGEARRAQVQGAGRVELLGPAEVPRLALLPVTLATAWPKGPRADHLVARATEMGAARLIPLRCERSVGGVQPLRPERLNRAERIAREACEQSGRPVLPLLSAAPVELTRILEEVPQACPIALVPGARPLGLELERLRPQEVLLLVGPEGGFSPAELEWLAGAQVARAGLVPTTLRTEAAGPLGVALCQHWFAQSRGG